MKKHTVLRVLRCGLSIRYERSVEEKLRLVRIARGQISNGLKAMLRIFNYLQVNGEELKDIY